MSFKTVYKVFFIGLFVLLNACSDADNEINLVNLHTVADLDVTSIDFPADTESILSINSEYDFQLQGLKSNGIDLIDISNNIKWSLSDGALSNINQQGHFTASVTAEIITLTAQFGHLTQSIEITVSDARFDQVVQFNGQVLSIDMCRSQDFKPIARYVDSNGADEIRPVDSTIINTIEWTVRDLADNNVSKRAHIETSNNQASLRTLAAGDLIIQATASSVFQGMDVTSADFSQNVSNGLNSIKICRNSDSDLSICGVTDVSVEKDRTLSLIAVGNYQAADGSNFNENISKNSKWGVDNTVIASIALPADQQRLDVTGNIENSNANVSVACGDIVEALDGVDIVQGVTLSSSVSCDAECFSSLTLVRVEPPSVDSLEVTANGISLENNTGITLNSRPAEITLEVIANFVNGGSEDVTSDIDLIYDVIAPSGQPDVVEEKSGSLGTFTVLSGGLAEIELLFQNRRFTVLITVP